MASEIDISNLALSHCGEDANISSFQEGSANADRCRRFYPIARDLVLEMAAWKFNTRRTSPAALSDTLASSWAYAYALPSDLVRVLAVLPPSAPDECMQPFVIETAADGTVVLLTNQPEAVLRYTVKITDTSKFSPLATDAICWLLTSFIAGPILKGQEGAAAGREAYKTFLGQFAAAAASDNNQVLQTQSDMSATIAARYGCSFPINQPYQGY